MNITQISVFLENRPGRLAHLLTVLSDAEVNLRALAVADTADFGIVRIIVDDVDKAVSAIHAASLTAATTSVLCVEVPDTPGALEKSVIGPLSEADVNIEYLYAYSETTETSAIVVLKVDDLTKANKALA
jgi:hypothetical protein